MRPDGLAGVCISDSEYQRRVAFTMLNRVLDDFVSKVAPVQWVRFDFSNSSLQQAVLPQRFICDAFSAMYAAKLSFFNECTKRY